MSLEKSGIVCVGMVCVDVLARPVDSYPGKGKLVTTNQVSIQIGGCAANAAIGLARIGTGATIVGMVGDDSFGKLAKMKLEEEGVDTSGLITGFGIGTASSIVMIDSSGERSVIHCFGANNDFYYENIDLSVLREKKIMLVAGTFLMPSFDGPSTESILSLAKEYGLTCCMDTAWDSSGEWMNKIERTIKYLDWFMPSYDEARELSMKEEPEEMAVYFQQKGARNIIIKLSNEGCYIREETGKGYHVPAYRNVACIDASGAGDAFCAGFIAGLNEGWDISKCARFANAAGAHCIMEIGTTSGIPSMQHLLEFIADYDTPIVF